MTRVTRPRLSSSRALTLLVALALTMTPVSMSALQSTSAALAQNVPPDVDVVRDWSHDVPAHLAVVDGSVTLERDGRVEAAAQNMALLAGDRLRTERGRVDVLFEDGSALDLDQSTSVEFLSDEMVRLDDGRIRMTLTRATPDGYRVDSAGTTSFLLAAGEYRVSVATDRAGDPSVTLTVVRGSAELSTFGGRTMVRPGMASIASAGSSPSVPYTVAVASVDGFDRWADQQRSDRVGMTSTQYLPADLRYYGGDLDRNGTWGYVAPYGYVWYPTVAVGWQPYYSGGWSFYSNFGWMWVGAGSWVWPTHHYGRWGYADRWYWIPDRHWGPSWVAWGGAPGYVGWCPLGYNNHAVFAVTAGFSYGNGYGSGYGHGWAVAPARAFNGAPGVRAAPIDGRTIAGTAASRFAAGRAPTEPASLAASRNSVPVRAPSVAASARATAQPRGASGGAGIVAAGAGVRDVSPRESPSRFATPRPSAVQPGETPPRAAAESRNAIAGAASRTVMPAASGFARSRDGTTTPGVDATRPIGSRADVATDPSRPWTPSGRMPSRTMEPGAGYSSGAAPRTPDSRGGLRSAPRGGDTPSRSWSAPSAPMPGLSRFPSSPPPSASGPSRSWSAPGGDDRSVAPASRPSGPSRMPEGRPSMSAPSGGAAGMPQGGAMPRAGAPSGGQAQSRGGRR